MPCKANTAGETEVIVQASRLRVIAALQISSDCSVLQCHYIGQAFLRQAQSPRTITQEELVVLLNTVMKGY